LRTHTGIELKPGKEAMVMGRLERRLRHHGDLTYTEYFHRLDDGGGLPELLVAIDLLTTNETYFFREPAHFEFLRTVLVPQPRNRPQSLPAPVRVWSAASSTGEEAYSIAMTLADCLPAEQSWEVVGTDISGRVLETAARGLYPVQAAERIPHRLLRSYCLRGRDEYDGYLAIEPALLSRVSFQPANLLELPGELRGFDVIFLRNVMIYFSQETRRELIREMETRLRPGGYLVVSHSETLTDLASGLRMVKPSIYRSAG
jgi:chemotaxis protein methyltransferase CheR